MPENEIPPAMPGDIYSKGRKTMWNDIITKEDITAFMESVYYFHDNEILR